MIIVAGHLIVEQNRRDEFLEKSKDAVLAARDNSDCLDFSVTADLVTQDRVCIYERWKDQESLSSFRGNGPGEDLSSLILGAEINEFNVDN